MIFRRDCANCRYVALPRASVTPRQKAERFHYIVQLVYFKRRVKRRVKK